MLLETKQLCKNFGGLRAVNNIDFAIDSGEVVAIIGPNGSGKTTFFNIISGILPVSSGQILFNDQDVTKHKAYQMAEAGLSRTFQNIRLFPGLSVWDNLIIGRYSRGSSGVLDGIFHSQRLRREEAANREKIKEILSFTGLDAVKDTLATNLPYGAQRRLEIARAMAAEPSLLLLDEPAAGMNPKEVDELLQLIRSLKEQGLTVLLIEHQMRLVMGIAERMVVFDHGEKIAEGDPTVVRNNPKVVETYIGAEVDECAEN